MRRSVAFLIPTVLLLGSACAAPTIEPTPLASGQWMAFASRRDGNWEIYRMRVDGSQVTNLTNDSAEDAWPSWGP